MFGFLESSFSSDPLVNVAVSHSSSDYSFRSSPSSFVGLDNQGATCYLNSLLQSLFLLPEFRSSLFCLSDEELGTAAYDAHRKEIKEKEQNKDKQSNIEEQVVDQALVNSLVEEFGFSRSHVLTALNKFSSREEAIEFILNNPQEEENQDKTTPSSTVSSSSNSTRRPYLRIPIEFRRLFGRLLYSVRRSINTEDLTRSFGWSTGAHDHAHIQHDIHELYTQLIEALNGSLQQTSHSHVIPELFQGELSNLIQCSHCKAIRERKEKFYSLHVHVKGLNDLTSSLQYFVSPELLSGPNSVFCSSNCQQKRDSKTAAIIRHLPPVLTLALNRHEFDPKTWQRMKIQDKFAFPLILDLEPFMNTSIEAEPKIPIQELMEIMRKSATSNEETKEDGEKDNGNNNNGEKISGNKQKQKTKKQRRAEEEEKEKVIYELEQPPYNPYSPHLYDLFAVVIHAGNSSHRGHYFAYLKDVLPPTALSASSSDSARWFHFNDSTVTPIAVEQVAQQYGGKRECAYMLIYRKRSLNQQINYLSLELPQDIKLMVQQENRQLHVEKLEWERISNELPLEIHLDQRFQLVDGGLRPIDDQTISASSVFSFLFDQRSTVRQFLADIRHQCSISADRRIEFNPFYMKSSPPHALDSLSFDLTNDLDRPVQSLGLKANDKLILWDGQTIGGSPFKWELKQEKKFHFKVLDFLSSNSQQQLNSIVIPDSTSASSSPSSVDISIPEFSFSIPHSSRLTELFHEIQKNFPSSSLEDLDIFILQRNGECNSLSTFSLEALIHEADLREGSLFIVQSRHFASSQPLWKEKVHQWTTNRLNRILLKVQSSIGLTGNKSTRSAWITQEIEVNIDMKLSELKRIVLENECRRLPMDEINNKNTRFRRLLGQNSIGSLYLEEEKTLKQCDLDCNEMEILLESGHPPGANEMELVVFAADLQGNDYLFGDSLVIDRSFTILQLKQILLNLKLQLSGMKHFPSFPLISSEPLNQEDPVHEFTLYRLNVSTGEREKPLVNEFLPLEKLKIQPGDVLRLEKGETKRAEKVKVQVFWNGIKQAKNHESWGDDKLDFQEKKVEKVENSPLTSDSAVSAAVEDNVAAQVASLSLRSSLEFLHSFDLPVQLIIGDVKSIICHHLTSAYPELSTLLSSSFQLRLRQLTRSDRFGRLICGDSISLKKSHWTEEKRIGVELRKEEENLSQQAYFIRLMRAKRNTKTDLSNQKSSVESPEFPNSSMEIALDPPAFSDFPSFLRWISTISGIENGKVGVALWSTGNEREWKFLCSAMANAGDSEGSKKKAKGPGKQKGQPAGKSPIKEKPYSIKENDLLAVFDLDELGYSGKEHSEVAKVIQNWQPPSGNSVHGMSKEEEEKEKEAEKDKEKKKKQRREEIALTIEY